ncbi:MAG: exodeoxyribonuclease III [Myxococcales bacterium]|nr:exodeoxyribonuclease III [Myxococcales bacterium]
MRIVSWNVNGLRAVHAKGFLPWLAGCGADVVCVQEIRARPEQLPPELVAPPGWFSALAPAERLGYSGVALYARRAPDALQVGLGEPEFDVEGRLQVARWGDVTVVNGYFPNGNGKERDNSRIPYKLAFYQAVFDHLKPAFDAGQAIVVLGDFNTAPEAIDLARPKDNEKTSGFTPIERAEVRRWLAAGWVDTFRHFHPDQTGAYSWWSQRFGVREKNIGWRIDLALASPGAMPFLRSAEIHHAVRGSDHCPILVTLDGRAPEKGAAPSPPP